MPLPDIIKSIFAGGADKIITAFGDAIDKNITSKEERETLKNALKAEVDRNVERMQELSNQELEIFMRDTDSARQANARIQETEKASWLAKNVGYCIDIFIIVVWGFLTCYLLCMMLNLVKRQDGVDYTAVTAVWGGVTAMAGTVLQFHRGSSRGSEEKQKQIISLQQKN